MRKTLIVYASKTGTTGKCMEILKNFFPRAEYADLAERMPDPSEYNLILFGCGIRMGMIHKKLRKWISLYGAQIKERDHAIFICNGNQRQTETILIRNFGKELLETAICAASFGGITDYKQFKGMDRLILKMITNQSKGRKLPEGKILDENIKAFAETVKNYLNAENKEL